jgi:hypothetical protein
MCHHQFVHKIHVSDLASELIACQLDALCWNPTQLPNCRHTMHAVLLVMILLCVP